MLKSNQIRHQARLDSLSSTYLIFELENFQKYAEKSGNGSGIGTRKVDKLDTPTFEQENCLLFKLAIELTIASYLLLIFIIYYPKNYPISATYFNKFES
jgi:hypothetical protein